MNETLIAWLSDVVKDNLVISPEDVSQETRANYWSFDFSETNSARDVVEFFDKILENWSQRISGKMTFYVWFDEIDHHLSCCIASVSKQNLPFGCEVTLLENLEELVAKYFSSSYFNGIPTEEFKEISVEEAFSKNDEEIDFELSVWCQEVKPRLNS